MVPLSRSRYVPGTGSLDPDLQVGEKNREVKGVDVALHLLHQSIQLTSQGALTPKRAVSMTLWGVTVKTNSPADSDT